MMRTFAPTLSAPQLRRLALLISLCLAAATAHANARQDFGKAHFPIACNDSVQDEFDLALAMLHTFSFPDAAKTFTAVAQKDPDCAIAYWGIAATAIGSLYGGRPGPEALQGERAVEKAKAIGGKNARERDYIATIEVFYRAADKLEYATRVRAYANALDQLRRKYPEDREAEIFYAYALSALGAPTDQTFTYALKGAAILEKLFAELPDHPGVIHYLLHTYDNRPHASRGLTAALRFAKVAPSSPHALQFYAHIFNRMGLWHESIDTNRAGATVDDLFFKPHAMDFLVHSYLQTGQAVAAKRVVDEVKKIKIIPHLLDAFAVAAMPFRHAIERRRWDEAAALTLPQAGTFVWQDFPHEKDLDLLQHLRANLIKANSEGTWQEYWVSKIENDRQVVAAWIAYKEGRRDEALRTLRAAADHEDSTEWDPVMPGHIISARQNLGEMLLDADDPPRALQAFRAALKTEPFRFWSLYGAGRAADLSGDRAKAEAYYAMLVGQTASADVQQYPDLKAARAFLEKE